MTANTPPTPNPQPLGHCAVGPSSELDGACALAAARGVTDRRVVIGMRGAEEVTCRATRVNCGAGVSSSLPGVTPGVPASVWNPCWFVRSVVDVTKTRTGVRMPEGSSVLPSQSCQHCGSSGRTSSVSACSTSKLVHRQPVTSQRSFDEQHPTQAARHSQCQTARAQPHAGSIHVPFQGQSMLSSVR
jgi:hypothetical protein